MGPGRLEHRPLQGGRQRIVAEARKYTANVVKVYTPNATWAKVKAAAQGANVLVYLGHGNGWPSPYAPFQTIHQGRPRARPLHRRRLDQDRLLRRGLDPLVIRLAPNAAVLLFHLCYASGNTEPGMPVGTFTDSRERIDNYGAGFIGAGARAVFAEGHPEHPATELHPPALHHQPDDGAGVPRGAHVQWQRAGPLSQPAHARAALPMDPDTRRPSGFYRSLIGDLALTARSVTGPVRSRPPGPHPADFVVPGAAEVRSPGSRAVHQRSGGRGPGGQARINPRGRHAAPRHRRG